MASRLELYLDHTNPSHVITVSRPDGSSVRLPVLRLITYANFLGSQKPSPNSGRHVICECLIDTGAYWSIIPQQIWQLFLPGIVTPLTFDASVPQVLREVVIGGRTYPYTLGELSIRLEDRRRKHMYVTIIAKLTQDGGHIGLPLILGLRGGFLEGRKLLAEPDYSAPYGQKWTLE